MRAPGLFLAALLLVAACAGPTPVPTTQTPPSAAAATTPQPERQLRLGQTFGLIYDPELERVLLVNGGPESGPARPIELWTWDGTAWELLDDAGPETRNFGSVARDPERGVVVVHGGMSSSGSGVMLDETLEWEGETWTTFPLGDEGPGDREGPGLAWDPATRRMLLFGGASDGELQSETWSWSGTAWTQVADSGPRSRFVNLMTEDRSGDGGVLLHGGHWVEGNGGGNLEDTWRWDGAAWSELLAEPGPGQRVNSPGAWDERLGGIVMFGGGQGETPDPGTNDTWLWTDEDGWTQLDTPTAPSQRNAHGLAFDSKRQVLVLVGGIDRPGGTQRLDVWEFGADGWREVLAPS